ncbi:MAG TPA: nucleotidyltransferase [Puia sp.]
MTLAQDFEDFVKLLNLHGVEYMVVGGYALAFHGKPRHTGDLDIWISISEKNAVRILRVLKEFGLSSMDFKKEDFLKPGYMSQIGYPPLRIDILNSIDGVEFKDAIQNMLRLEIDNDFTINYIGLNDFVKNKQASGRSQDLADIQEIQKLKAGKKVTRKKRGGS